MTDRINELMNEKKVLKKIWKRLITDGCDLVAMKFSFWPYLRRASR